MAPLLIVVLTNGFELTLLAGNLAIANVLAELYSKPLEMVHFKFGWKSVTNTVFDFIDFPVVVLLFNISNYPKRIENGGIQEITPSPLKMNMANICKCLPNNALL